jgi:hypothetical protein
MKVTTNGNPNVERNRKKSEQVQKKGMAPAPTKKKSSTQAPTKTTATTAKAAPMVAKQAVQAASAKQAPRHRSIEVDEVYTEADHHTSDPPRNPRRILEAADGSDDNMEEGATPEEIPINSNDDDEDT